MRLHGLDLEDRNTADLVRNKFYERLKNDTSMSDDAKLRYKEWKKSESTRLSELQLNQMKTWIDSLADQSPQTKGFQDHFKLSEKEATLRRDLFIQKVEKEKLGKPYDKKWDRAVLTPEQLLKRKVDREKAKNAEETPAQNWTSGSVEADAFTQAQAKELLIQYGLSEADFENAAAFRKAYKKLALKEHPDKHGGSHQSAERFKSMVRAVQVYKQTSNFGAYTTFFGGGKKRKVPEPVEVDVDGPAECFEDLVTVIVRMLREHGNNILANTILKWTFSCTYIW